MPNFFNIIIILLFVVGPIINKIYQSMAEKQAMEQERQRRLRESVRTQRARGENPEIAPETRVELERTAPASTRQADLAARRKAEIEAWRARQAAARQQQAQRPTSASTQSGWNPAQQGTGTSAATPSQAQSVDSEITRRRRAAIEEMRRRRGESSRADTSAPTKQSPQKRRRKQTPPTPPEIPATTPIPSEIQPSAASLVTGRRGRRGRRVRATPATAFAGLGSAHRLAAMTSAQLREAIILKELLDTPPGLRDLNDLLDT